MNTPEKPETKKLAGLAKTFSTACEKAATQGKVQACAAPVLTAALVLLVAAPTPQLGWT